jgi:hypothetical protein
MIVNHVYELPFGRTHQYLSSGLLGQVIGNWQISGIWSVMTGTHFSPTLATGVTNTAEGTGLFSSGTERPVCSLGGGDLPSGERTLNRWFNVGAFSIPQTYTFGNCGAYILIGPGYFSTDLGIHRSFSITEGKKLTFRWEMFNAFNRAKFSNPKRFDWRCHSRSDQQHSAGPVHAIGAEILVLTAAPLRAVGIARSEGADNGRDPRRRDRIRR